MDCIRCGKKVPKAVFLRGTKYINLDWGDINVSVSSTKPKTDICPDCLEKLLEIMEEALRAKESKT